MSDGNFWSSPLLVPDLASVNMQYKTSPDCWKLLNVITCSFFYRLCVLRIDVWEHRHPVSTPSLSLTPSCPVSCSLAGKLWSRSIKLAYNILHKLGSKQEPMVRPGDRVSHTPAPPQTQILGVLFCSFFTVELLCMSELFPVFHFFKSSRLDFAPYLYYCLVFLLHTEYYKFELSEVWCGIFRSFDILGTHTNTLIRGSDVTFVI